MFGLIGECDNLCLYRRAVTRAYTLNLAVVKGRIRQPLPKDVVRSAIGIYRETTALSQFASNQRQIGKFVEILLQFLRLGQLPFYGTSVDTHRCAGFHPFRLETHPHKLLCDAARSRFGTAPAFNHGAPHMHKPVKECAVGKHHRPGIKHSP